MNLSSFRAIGEMIHLPNVYEERRKELTTALQLNMLIWFCEIIQTKAFLPRLIKLFDGNNTRRYLFIEQVLNAMGLLFDFSAFWQTKKKSNELILKLMEPVSMQVSSNLDDFFCS